MVPSLQYDATVDPLLKLKSFHLSTCLKCGSFFSRRSLFCSHCYRQLRPDRLQIHRSISPLSCSALFFWRPGQSDSLSLLFNLLKGAQHEEAWRFYAREFWRSASVGGIQVPPRAVLIPSPAKNMRMRDHAHIFAEGLSEFSGVPMLPLLKKDSDFRAQKEKSVSQRREFRLELRENFSLPDMGYRHVILVDDIVTTGATAVAAKRALAGIESFEVWALAMRSFGCD